MQKDAQTMVPQSWNENRNAILPTLRKLTIFGNERGVTSVTVALLGTILVAISAFAIDIGHALVTQNELQNASDAAALAAARQLGVNYLALPMSEQQDLERALTGNEQSQILAQRDGPKKLDSQLRYDL